MKIALFSDSFVPEVNGVSNTVYRLAMELSDLGHEVCVFTVSGSRKIELEVIAKKKFKIVVLPSMGIPIYLGAQLTVPLGLALNKIRKFQPDIIHAHTLFSVGWEAVWAARMFHIPLIGTHHTFYDQFLKHIHLNYQAVKEFSWKYTAFYYNRCDYTACPSHTLAKKLEESGLKNACDVLPNPVDLDLFNPDLSAEKKREIKNKWQIPEKSLVYMGRVSYEKSIDQVIKAVAVVKKNMPNIGLVIIGDGPELPNLRKLVSELKLEDNVIFTGFLFNESLVQAVQANDILLTASKCENMPLSILEGMAAGMPVIAARALGLKEIIKDGENGFLFTPDNPTELAEKILKLINNEELKKKFSHTARERALPYSQKYVAQLHVEYYQKILNDK